MSQTAKRLAELGVVLPKAAAPVANYVPFVRTSGLAPSALPLLFVSGQIPLGPDGKLDERHKGKLGPDSPIDAAREAAELGIDQRRQLLERALVPGTPGAEQSGDVSCGVPSHTALRARVSRRQEGSSRIQLTNAEKDSTVRRDAGILGFSEGS